MVSNHTAGIFKNKFLLFALLAIFALVVWSSITLQEILFNSIETLTIFARNHYFVGTAFFIFLTALSSLLSPFSSVPLVPISVAIWGGGPTVVFLMTGWMIGAIASYFLGVAVDKSLLQHLANVEKVNYYKEKIAAHSNFYAVLIFRLALPAEITGYSLGILRYHFGKYLLAVFLSELPFALLAVFSGQALLEKDFLIFSAVVLFSIGLVFLLLKLFKQKFGEPQ